MFVPFRIGELRRALDKAGQTAPGKDEICYCMINHLSVGSLEKLLLLYNRVWVEGKMPVSWKEAIVIPIRKSGKDGSRPGSYERTIQVKIGAELSSQCVVENGTPQRSVISPALFSIMINDVFVNIPMDVESSLFADDGELWKRGRNV